MDEKTVIILGIETSCDETAAAVLSGNNILANIIAGQKVHENYGGVVPELASRAHQQNIIPVVDEALKKAGIKIRLSSSPRFPAESRCWLPGSGRCRW